LTNGRPTNESRGADTVRSGEGDVSSLVFSPAANAEKIAGRREFGDGKFA
jgi:hypothetical protein